MNLRSEDLQINSPSVQSDRLAGCRKQDGIAFFEIDALDPAAAFQDHQDLEMFVGNGDLLKAS